MDLVSPRPFWLLKNGMLGIYPSLKRDMSCEVVILGAGISGALMAEALSSEEFTAKDFRTWAGTVLAARALQEFEKFNSEAEAKRNLGRAIEAVAKMLGNTAPICRRCYVHPVIMDAYLDGSLVERLKRKAERKLATGIKSLRPEEAAVLMLLQQTLSKDRKKRQT